MARSVLQVLIAARKRISKREHWTKGVMARDRIGLPTSDRADDACSFCSIGAVRASSASGVLVNAATNELWISLKGLIEISDFNDDRSTTHRQVLALFDRTIKRLRAA